MFNLNDVDETDKKLWFLAKRVNNFKFFEIAGN